MGFESFVNASAKDGVPQRDNFRRPDHSDDLPPRKLRPAQAPPENGGKK